MIQMLFFVVLAVLAVAIGYKVLQCISWGMWAIYVRCRDAYGSRMRILVVALIVLLPLTLVVSFLLGLFVVFHLPVGMRNSWPSREK